MLKIKYEKVLAILLSCTMIVSLSACVKNKDTKPIPCVCMKEASHGYPHPSIKGDGFEDLSDAVDDTFDSITQEFEDIREEADPDAVTYLEYDLGLCDCDVVSFFLRTRCNYDYRFRGYTFSIEGDLLTFENLLLRGKREAFYTAAEEFITNTYGEVLITHGHSEIPVSEVIEQFENMEDEPWFLDASSVVFLYRERSDVCVIHLPYSVFDEYLDPDYIPHDQPMIGRYSLFELNYSEGHKLNIDYDSECQNDLPYNSSILTHYYTGMTLDGVPYEFDEEKLQDCGTTYYIRDYEGKSYLAVSQRTTDSARSGLSFTIYDITDGEYVLIGTNDGRSRHSFIIGPLNPEGIFTLFFST